MGLIHAERLVALYGGTLRSDDFDQDSVYVVKVKKGRDTFFLDGCQGGTIASFINHSCEPNCALADYVYKGQLIVCIVSSRVIHAGEYLSINYGDHFDHTKLCCCGAPSCKDLDCFIEYRRRNFPIASFF